MKTKSIFIVMFILVYSCKFYPQQHIIGPLLSDCRTTLYKTGSNSAGSEGLLSPQQVTKVGKLSGTCYRALYQWNIPDNVIPDNAIINSVEITYLYSIQGVNTGLIADFYCIPTKIDSSQDYTGMWNMFESANKIAGGYGGISGTLIAIPDQTDMPKFNDVVKRSLPANRFVLGIMSNTESLNEDRYFFINTGYVELKVIYSLPYQSVRVTQILSTGAEYGNVGRYEGNSFIDRITGTTYSLEVGSTEYFRADTNKATVADEKFNSWNDPSSVLNHNAFPISTSTSSIVSRFFNIGNATIKNYLGEIPSTNVNTIDFRDPWLRDDNSDSKGLRNRGSGAIWHSYSSPFVQNISSNRFKGVLLNQLRTSQNFYSARTNPTIDVYLPQTGKTHKFYFYNWTATNATVSSPLSLGTPVVFTANNSEVLANYKGNQISTTQSAFSNSSQRKFIRTPDGVYHLVYESMGKIWYERSADMGTTWTLGNNGKPLNTDYIRNSSGQVTGTGNYTTAKEPSIDYYQNYVFVVWEEQSGSNYLVRLTSLLGGARQDTVNCIPFSTSGQYSENIYPEIAIKDNSFGIIAIRRNDSYYKGLEVHYMALFPNTGTATSQCTGYIPGTTQNTGSFTIATDRSSTDKYHIAWEECPASAADSILYTKFNFTLVPGGPMSPQGTGMTADQAASAPGDGGDYQMNIIRHINVSLPTSYIKVYSPSMIGANDGTARLAFKGYTGSSYRISSCCPENLSWIPYLRKYYGEVFSPQISLGSETYYVGWTELNNSNVYKTIATDASTLSLKEAVAGSLGRDMQINTGGTRSQQFSLSFNSESTSLPYSFKLSEAIGTIVSNKKLEISSGRGIFLTNGENQLYFTLGNITVDGVNVDFIKAQDTVNLEGSLKKVNSFMTTEPFTIKANSTLSFAAVYGVKDSLASVSFMKEGDFASFKVEVIDDASGRVIGNYLSEKIDKRNIYSLKESAFKISSDGIGGKILRLRVSVNENMKSEYTISDMFLGGGILLSKSMKETEMGLEGSLHIKDYSLSQNYPNPFNPTTVISYALPRASKVSLKVYDILGKEVATLAEGYKEMGKYTAEFNAKDLPSGIYIYELRANDFVKSGKMMLIK